VDATPVTPEPETPAASAEIPYWQDPRRVTVLLMGIDQRQGEEGTFPTDTMILFSVDPVGHTAAILSIPRDLWVDYPGMNQSGRINGANILGDQVAFPGGGGPALAMRTVESMLGVPVNYYVLINFEVFTTLIDVIGPVEVCPSEPIDDDKYPDGSYGFITIHFDAGCQELNSERLLQYARTRHGDSDISRGTRQQEVIMAVRQKVLTTGGIMALVPEAQSLWDSLQNNFRTNMSFNDMLSLARTAESVPDGNIRQDQISFEDVSMSTTPEGDSILVPYSSDILSIVQDLFRPPDGQ
jgi:LCP family protein required for cell wall assembly